MKIETDEQKLQVLIQIVKEKQLNFGYAPLTNANAQMQAEAWIDHLVEIPMQRLRDCYKEGMRNRDPKTPFSTTDMVQAWRRLRDRESEDARINPPCSLCKGSRVVRFGLDADEMESIPCPGC